MKIKVSKHKLKTHYRGSPRGSQTQQHVYCFGYAHPQHIESHLGKRLQQAKKRLKQTALILWILQKL